MAERREQSAGEEIANALSHGVGLVVALAATPTLLAAAWREGDVLRSVGASVFAATVVFLYLASTLYHAAPRGRAKDVLRLIEHSGIFLLIAGTYTPFTLGVLRGPRGFTLLTVIWLLAAVGITFKAIGFRRRGEPVAGPAGAPSQQLLRPQTSFGFRRRAEPAAGPMGAPSRTELLRPQTSFGGLWHPRLSLALYLGMGWLIVIAAGPMWERLPAPGLGWLVAGGLAYTVGTAFYSARRLPFAHFVWHLFVLTGTGCHFVAVMRYAA